MYTTDNIKCPTSEFINFFFFFSLSGHDFVRRDKRVLITATIHIEITTKLIIFICIKTNRYLIFVRLSEGKFAVIFGRHWPRPRRRPVTNRNRSRPLRLSLPPPLRLSLFAVVVIVITRCSCRVNNDAALITVSRLVLSRVPTPVKSRNLFSNRLPTTFL